MNLISSGERSRSSLIRVCFLVSMMVLTVAIPVRALTINVTYSGVTPGDTIPCAAGGCVAVPLAAQTAFNNVATLYDSMFTNNIQVYIEVQWGNTGLGRSDTLVTGVDYATWTNTLAADGLANSNPYATSGAAANPAGANGMPGQSIGSNVGFTTANAKALGFSIPGATAANPDSILTFNKTPNTFEFTGTATPSRFDFISVAEHELNEALGIGSNLTGIADNGALPGQFSAEDYFRYNNLGRDVTTNPADTGVFFSYNGGSTLLANSNFNQVNGNGDRNDWLYGCVIPSFVQDAGACPNAVANSPFAVNSPEQFVLQTLGWDELPTPEPATFVFMGAGILSMALLRRRARRS